MYSQIEHDKAIFYFDILRDMCCDIDIQEDADCLVLGNEEEKCSYKLSDVNKVFPQVKTLYIGPNVIDIVIRNAMFPNVEKVISDNPMFASGNMLVKHHILLNAFYQTDDAVIDLKDVFLIKAFAFNGCRAKKFINTADIKVCSEKAFAGSALLKDNPQPIITAGSILVKIAEDADEIEIPEYITMVMPDIHFRKIRKLCLPGLTHPVTTTVRMDDAPPVIAFKNSCELHDFCMTFKTCKEFEIIGDGAYKSVDGIIYSADMSILVKCPAGREGKIVIPDGVVEIAPGAFSNSCIQEVVFPDSLRKLGMSAFSFCKRLERVDFGRGLKEIGDYDNNNCFRGCSKITSLDIPEQVTFISPFAFQKCQQLKTLILHEGIECIEDSAFADSKIETVEFPASLKCIGTYAFLDTSQVVLNSIPAGLVSSISYNNVINTCTTKHYTELIFKSDDFHAFLPKSISWNPFEEYDSNPGKVKDTALCRLANEPSYEYDTAFTEYRYNKNQKIKEYLKKNSKEIIQWLIDLSDEKRLIYFLQSELVDKNDVGQIVDEILNSNLENKSVIAAYALNGQKTEQKEENIAFAL